MGCHDLIGYQCRTNNYVMKYDEWGMTQITEKNGYITTSNEGMGCDDVQLGREGCIITNNYSIYPVTPQQSDARGCMATSV